MNKIVDGVELLRMLRDGEIERGRKIKVSYDTNYSDVYYFSGCNIRHLKGDYEIGSERLLNKKFKYELLDEEIDIQAIKEMNLFSVSNWEKLDDIKLFLDNNFKQTTDKYNELIKAVKKLDKKIKEKE